MGKKSRELRVSLDRLIDDRREGKKGDEVKRIRGQFFLLPPNFGNVDSNNC